jgi:hypothetical protein
MFLFMMGTDIRIDVLLPAFYRKLSDVDGLADVKTAQFALKPRFSYADRQGDK